MILVGLNINPVLKKQIRTAFPENINFLGDKRNLRTNMFLFFQIIGLRNRNILIYNTSVLNLFALCVLRLNSNKIYFHLHDPIPHSGILNPIVFIVNYVMVKASHTVLVFSNKLQTQTLKLYKKKSEIVTHGNIPFKYYPTKYNKEARICVGFFGRNMPYKNYNSFLNFIKTHPNYIFVTVGNGYPQSNNSNHSIYNGYIPDDLYYSLMHDMDYIYFAHTDISYSGVINDCLYLKKPIISSNNKWDEMNYPFLVNDIENLKKMKKKTDLTQVGWEDYNYEIKNLFK